MKPIKILLLVILFIFLSNMPAFSKIGGEISGIYYLSDMGNMVGAELKFGDTFTPFNRGFVRWELKITYPSYEGDIDFEIEKLYLKYKFEDIHIIIGRMPVSWGFGSIMNPFSFQDERGWIDGTSIHIFLKDELTLNIVYSRDKKWGIRARTTISGYDISLNFISSPENQRIGLTFKGDMEDIGIYGGIGYTTSNTYPIFLVGCDYSHYFETGSKIFLQAEYTNTSKGIAPSYIPMLSLNNPEDMETNGQLILVNTTYIIDEFSNISLDIIHNFDKTSTIIIPLYQNQMSDNFSYKIGGMLHLMPQDKPQKGLFFEINYNF